MADQTQKPKYKLKRSTLFWIVPAIIIPTVIFLFVSKGADLGQSKENVAIKEKADKDKAEKISERVIDPTKAAEEDARQADILAQEKAKEFAKSHPGLPPAPGAVSVKSEELRLKELAASRDIIASTLPADEKQSTGLATSKHGGGATQGSGQGSGFVVYVAPVKDGLIPTSTEVKDAVTLEKPKDEPKVKPFLDANNDKVKPETVTTATRIDGTHWIAAGTVVRAVLLNAVDTRIPGQVTARTTEPIFDSRYGRTEVIPVGSTLIGEYDSKIANGQVRVMMAFKSLITPSGGVVNLNGIRASDAIGRMGVEGELHTHFWTRMGIATMFALESVGMDRLSNRQTTVNSGSGTTTTTDISSGAQIIADAAKQEIAARTSLGPNITIDEGQKISIITTGNIEIPPVASKR